jgi:hypothetical protein
MGCNREGEPGAGCGETVGGRTGTRDAQLAQEKCGDCRFEAPPPTDPYIAEKVYGECQKNGFRHDRTYNFNSDTYNCAEVKHWNMASF